MIMRKGFKIWINTIWGLTMTMTMTKCFPQRVWCWWGREIEANVERERLELDLICVPFEIHIMTVSTTVTNTVYYHYTHCVLKLHTNYYWKCVAVTWSDTLWHVIQDVNSSRNAMESVESLKAIHHKIAHNLMEFWLDQNCTNAQAQFMQ